MLELIQFPYSPFCIVQRRILEYSGVRFKITNIPNTDRSLIWKLSRQRYYQVPILKDGSEVIFETGSNSQVIAKYIDEELDLGLFPKQWEGIQDILWAYIEDEIEGLTFKLNDIYWEDHVPAKERLNFVRHKERKFGAGCLQQWRDDQRTMVEQLEQKLMPFERMLETRDFLLEERPRFVDFDLFGMLGNFLYSGHYEIPTPHSRLIAWHTRMAKIKLNKSAREKLHS